jgi:hypothetical protein
VDRLGDENCHAIEVCLDDDSTSPQCRISTAFVPMGPLDSVELNVTVANINCKIYSSTFMNRATKRTLTTERIPEKCSKSSNWTKHFQRSFHRNHYRALSIDMTVD